jgi:nitrate reductase cytochrome c-type subunit
MKRVLFPLVAVSLTAGLLLPFSVMADEDDYEKDARYAEGTPPVVPHKMDVNATGDACLVCHLEGKNGAPVSPHSVRIDCVQCHVQGEIKEKKESRKKKQKKHHEKE